MPPPGLVILGGQSNEGHLLKSTENFGLEDCTIPPLPETRYNFGSFIFKRQEIQHPSDDTDTPIIRDTEKLAVCGGWWMGKPYSTDCLTLNMESGQWERGEFENGALGDGVRGVITTDKHGVFMIHRSGFSILQPNTASWVPQAVFPTPAECGCKISSTSFVTVHMGGTQNVLEYKVDKLEDFEIFALKRISEQLQKATYLSLPNLQLSRNFPFSKPHRHVELGVRHDAICCQP